MRILVQLETVIRNPYDDQPIGPGILFTAPLIAFSQVILMSSLNRESAERWCAVNRVLNYDDLVTDDLSLVEDNLEQRQFNMARAHGGIGLLITGDPRLWAYSFDHGVPAVLFGSPSAVSPELRHDAPKSIRSWSMIEQRIDKQNEEMTKAARLVKEERINL